jgi:hypothetical protein
VDAEALREKFVETLRRTLSLALLDPSAGWSESVERLAITLAGRAYRDLFDDPMPVPLRKRITTQVAKMLEKTDRERENHKAQADLIAEGLAAYVTETVLDAGTGDGWVKEWVTAGDDKVRPSHRQAGLEGPVPAGEPFNVGGHEMFGPGDLTAPIEEWANCRCHSRYRRAQEGEPMVAAANPEGFVIVALPAPDDPVNEASSETYPHITVLYLSVDFLEQARQVVAGVAPKHEPFTVTTLEIGTLGEDKATVAHLDPGPLAAIREELDDYEPIAQGMAAVEQFPEWTPHLTLGYPETPPPGGDLPDTIVIDRLAIMVDNETLDSEFALGEAMTAAATETEVEEVEIDPADVPIEWEEIPLYGALAPEEIPTGDKRKFLHDSLLWVEPPLSLRWQERDDEGHKGSVVTGRIDRIWREDGLLKWEGRGAMNAHADEMVAQVANGELRGVSVDLDDTEVEFHDSEGQELAADDQPTEQPVMAVTRGRVRSAIACAIPAFIEAFIAIGSWADHESGDDKTDDVVPEPDEASIAASAASILAFAPGTQDGPGWLTHPVDTDRLRDYWVHGEGGLKIGWGIGGDFNRCRVLLAPYVKAQHLAGYCANRHKDALGFWPGEHRGGKIAATIASAQEQYPDDIAPMFTIVSEPEPVVASGNSLLLRPPREWFERPAEFANIDQAVPHVVTEEGRIYGYCAGWGTCHVAYRECITPPNSPSNYTWFRLGDKVTDGGNVPIGVITIGTGHASLSLDAFNAAAHYDNTGTAVAQVACGEDEHGIWIAGCISPSATPEQIDDLRASKLSGDWRPVSGSREMIRVLAVNTPGFPIPRMALAASASGEETCTALVAAGVIESSDERIHRMVKEAVESTLASRDREMAMGSIRERVAARRRAQIAAFAARKDG